MTNFNMTNYDNNDVNAMLAAAADDDIITMSSDQLLSVINSPVSSDKTENDVNTINTISQEEISMTNSNVSAIVNFGTVASNAVTFNGQGVSLAEVFASVIYKQITPVFFSADSDEQKAKEEARVNNLNAKSSADRAAFIAKFEGRLGSLIPTTLVYDAKETFAKATLSVKANLQALFTMKATSEVKEAVVSGRPEVLEASVINVSNANPSLVLFSTIAAATVKLTGVERAELLAVLFNTVNNGATVTLNGISINLESATVNTGARVLTANKASCFGTIIVGADTEEFIVLDGAHSVFMFALQAFGGSEKQAQTAVNLAIKLFTPEHNYGHKPDTDDISFFVRANLVYSNAVAGSNSTFPSFSVKGGKQHPDFLSYVLGRGVIAASDKTNIKFVTIGDGAEATGLGWNRELNVMMTVNDVNKPSKLINRGAANNYDCADLPNRVASNFGFKLSSGNVAHTKGRMMKVAYTNSVLLTAGSGTGTINPNTFFEYSVDKNLKFPFHFSLLGSDFVNNVVAQDSFIAALFSQLEAKKGSIFAPGEEIVSVNGIKLIANTEVCSSVEFIEASVKRNVLDNNEVDIVAHVRLCGKSQFVKTRRFATKFTTTPYNVQGLSQEWEIILNNECTKGQGALLEMFANQTGVRYVNNNTGEFSTPAGDVINLLNEDNAFQSWKETSTQKEVITITIAKSVYNNIKEFAASELVVIGEDDTTVTVQETVSVIFGSLVFDVEISTPLESVSTSSMTLESASAVYLQSKKIGEAFFNEVNNKTEVFNTLAKRFANDSNNMEEVQLDNDENYYSFLDLVSDIDTKSISQKELFTVLGKLFPNGVRFTVGISTLELSFLVARTFGQFNPLNGSAARENAQIVNFLLDVIDNGAQNSLGLIVNAARAFTKILDIAVNSKNVLKKPTRSGRLVYGKVRTGLHPLLNTVDGIPTVVINANCPIVKLLGVKDGSFVGFARTPMPFLGAGRVVLTTDASICDIAHVLLDPYIFHSLCEGDSDGDGIALLNLASGKTKVSLDEAKEINDSLMGIAGYRHLYGANVPFADFMSVKDKYGKKNPAAKVAMLATSIKNPDSANEENISLTPAVLGDFASRVANHYKANVGVGYGICSKLIFQAADVAAKGDSAELTTLTEACLVAWRLLYEGLGLSGYSREAYNAFDIINKASVDTKALQVALIGNQIEAVFADPSVWTTRDLCVSGAQILSQAVPFNQLNLDVKVFELLISARTVTRAVAKLEGFGKEPSTWWAQVIPSTIKYGTLRRISQGDDRVSELFNVEEEAEMIFSGDFVAKPLTRHFQETIVVKEAFANQLLGNVAANVSAFHTTISNAKAAMKYSN
jgi:hypothetical protein